MEKIDVCINVFGKPWQTLCTLKSLMNHSGDLIDKIYLIKENQQPYNENIDWIFKYFDNLIIYTPKHYNFIKRDVNLFDTDEVLSVRYQYGIENTNKNYLLIIHNDVLFEDNIVLNLLNNIGESVGIGQIGQCWNCPLFDEGICDGDKLQKNIYDNKTYNEIISIVDKYPNKRTYYQSRNQISTSKPFPMPECRLNEWVCLIDINKVKRETPPNGNVPYFGLYSGVDLGSAWFREMSLKGYKFTNYNKDFIHGFWANKAGHPVLTNRDEYIESEKRAKQYFEKNLK